MARTIARPVTRNGAASAVTSVSSMTTPAAQDEVGVGSSCIGKILFGAR